MATKTDRPDDGTRHGINQSGDKASKEAPAVSEVDTKIAAASERVAAARQELNDALAADAAAKREGGDAAVQGEEVAARREAQQEAEAKETRETRKT